MIDGSVPGEEMMDIWDKMGSEDERGGAREGQSFSVCH